MAKKIIRLTEAELVTLVSRILREEALEGNVLLDCIKKEKPNIKEVPQACVTLFDGVKKGTITVSQVVTQGWSCAKGLGLDILSYGPVLVNIYNCVVNTPKDPIYKN